ncbi:retron St85 family RNA-directed DNA polymerase [Pseudomonas peli]|uniref:retron St85 family RNA-directed DNA polymerase n=1 Tax=Pseudomonas peli TaxID=592361 RepID=UPI003D3192F0
MQKIKVEDSWKFYFEDRGLPLETTEKYVSYIKALTSKNLPIIFELEHLSQLVGIKSDEVLKMVNAPEKFYRNFSIPKRKGGKREIHSPYPSLMLCQQWIYQNILLSQGIHSCAHGFAPGKSIVSNAKPHLNKKALLKMDLVNFFPSIPIAWVLNFFSALGYAHNVSYYLASLCCLNGFLAQGASTSPYLSNILLFSLDNRLNKLARAYDLDYTRYADDLIFSGSYIPHNFISIVEKIIEKYGLSPNREKTRLHTNPGQRIVTGVSVSGENLALPRSSKREIKKEFHYIRKHGYLSHIAKRKIKDPFYLDVVQGKIAFWLQIEPNDNFARNAFNYIKELKLSAN